MSGLFKTAVFALSLAGCAARPAEVRVGFDATRDVSVRERGFADRATKRLATADDPVRIASVSKLVVALGVMRLVESGTLDLDADVSDRLGWRLRDPAFPAVPITLRLLLSHRSGLTDGADYAIPLGDTLRARVGDPRAWDRDHAPGTFFRYTNLNFPVIASVMERATGERFDRLMARLVLAPLKLDACYNWTTCSDATIARTIVLYRADGSVAIDDLHGQRPACPVNTAGGCDLGAYRPGDNGALFSPQGGLRISVRDLATIGRLLLRDGAGFLRPASVDELERIVWRFDGTNGVTGEGRGGGLLCSYGLAIQTLATAQAGCADDPFGDARKRTGHAGEAYGLRSGLWIDRVRGTGVAFFTTAVKDGSTGRSAFSPQEERIVRER